jgi:hypothetical protein
MENGKSAFHPKQNGALRNNKTQLNCKQVEMNALWTARPQTIGVQ